MKKKLVFSLVLSLVLLVAVSAPLLFTGASSPVLAYIPGDHNGDHGDHGDNGDNGDCDNGDNGDCDNGDNGDYGNGDNGDYGNGEEFNGYIDDPSEPGPEPVVDEDGNPILDPWGNPIWIDPEQPISGQPGMPSPVNPPPQVEVPEPRPVELPPAEFYGGAQYGEQQPLLESDGTPLLDAYGAVIWTIPILNEDGTPTTGPNREPIILIFSSELPYFRGMDY